MKLPTDDLPWAMPVFPSNNTNTYASKEGDMVFGFFADGESGQFPIVLGVFPSIPLRAGNAQEAFSDSRTGAELADAPVKPYESATVYPRKLDEPTTSRLARNDSDYPSEIVQSKKDKKLSKVEPDPYYNAKYPYNNVYESESGHALEFDDTKGSERVHLYHRSGSYTEFGPEGDRSERIEKDKFTVVVGNDSVYVKGDVKVYVDGNVSMEVGGNLSAAIGGNMSAQVGGNASLQTGGNFSAAIGGSLDVSVGGGSTTIGVDTGGNCSLNSSRTVRVSSGTLINLSAPRVNFN
jgi:hypothetical protein